MRHPAAQLAFPPAIRAKTIAFLNWYFNDIHHGAAAPVHHAEHGEYEYDWHPRAGVSRLTLAHVPTGLIAMNAFNFTHLAETEASQAAPPFSLLMATWFDLCAALEWIDDGTVAELRDSLSASTAQDAHQFGQPIYG